MSRDPRWRSRASVVAQPGQHGLEHVLVFVTAASVRSRESIEFWCMPSSTSSIATACSAAVAQLEVLCSRARRGRSRATARPRTPPPACRRRRAGAGRPRTTRGSGGIRSPPCGSFSALAGRDGGRALNASGSAAGRRPSRRGRAALRDRERALLLALEHELDLAAHALTRSAGRTRASTVFSPVRARAASALFTVLEQRDRRRADTPEFWSAYSLLRAGSRLPRSVRA